MKKMAEGEGSMGQALLTVGNLSAWYGEEKRILSGFSFSLEEHEVAGLIGLNGAGKTTFLKVLSGLLPTFHSDGICFCGSPVAYARKVSDVSELIQGFHFEEYTDVLLRELSTGNRKKAFLITAFALKPRLLLLDEPVNGLDFQSTEYLYQQILGYKKYGTVLFSSHILESITLTSDRVFVLEEGKIRQTFEHGQISAEEIREALHDENDR